MGTEGRKLAAIMFTDIAGYSALTQANEARALETLGTHNHLLRPLFPKYGGREVKARGDGFMVEFASALEAVRCAIEIQRTLAGYNALMPRDEQIKIRIGLHVGDVVVQDDDIFGDGVNIASRIEPFAEPGGICLSEDVARQIVNKIDLPVRKLGKRELKNIHLPVNLYSVVLDAERRGFPFTDRLPARRRTRRSRPTAVLSAALASALLLRLWYALPRSAGTHSSVAMRGTESPRTVPLEARRFYDEGISVLNRHAPVENEKAITALQKAVALDPGFAEAHAELAQAYAIRFSYLARGEDRSEEQANYEVTRALDLKPDCAEAHLVRGILDWTPTGHFRSQPAIAEFDRALTLNPKLEGAYYNRGLVCVHLGLFLQALRDLESATEIQPYDTIAWLVIAQAHIYQGKYEVALKELSRTPGNFQPAMWSSSKAMALLCLRKGSEAAEVVRQFLVRNPKDPGGVLTSTQAILDAGAGKAVKARQEIRSAIERGSPFLHFHHTEYNIACAYALMRQEKDRELAIEWLTSAADDGFPCYPLFATSPLLKGLRANVQFQAFLKQQRQQWEQSKRLVRRG
jgi:class 3 adenylate cyclase/Tfp pilus assembly protein PilF